MENKLKPKERNSNIEIIRIISMIMIVLSHYTVHSGIIKTNLPLGLNRYLMEISSLGNIGVILFVLISGYFLIEQKEFKLKNLVKISLQVSFYSISIYLIMAIAGYVPYGITSIIRSFLPISFKEYWFVTTYVILYCLTPLLNKLLNSVDRKKHLTYLCVLFILFSLLPFITRGKFEDNQLFEFILFYTIGGYLRKYPENILNRNHNTVKLLLFTLLCLLSSTLLFDTIGSKIHQLQALSVFLYSRRSPVAIGFAVSLFSVFANKKTFSNKFINSIAACTFGVYLIHDNNNIREFLWNNIINAADYIESNYFIIHLIVSVLAVFSVCVIIEYFRKSIFDYIETKYLNRHITDFQNKVQFNLNNLYNKFISK